MSHQDTVFYRGRTAVSLDFSAEEISSDGSVLLLEKLEREHKLLSYFSKFIPDHRDPLRTVHKEEKLLRQRVYTLMQGYQDTNDVNYLKNDPLYKDILEGDMASQPTLSRFENSMNKASIFGLCYAWLDRYVNTLKNRKKVTIDIDATDDPTYGHQQLSMFNGYYGQFMYNELFIHDGETGQIIVPVLRRALHPEIKKSLNWDRMYSLFLNFFNFASKLTASFLVANSLRNINFHGISLFRFISGV